MVSKATIPIINGLSDEHQCHCRANADLLHDVSTLWPSQRFKAGLHWRRQQRSPLAALARTVRRRRCALRCPKGYEPDQEIVLRAQARAALGGAQIKQFSTPNEAVADTHAIYTDVWTSMGFESESTDRLKVFQNYQLNLELFNKALPTAIALHCLPMIRDGDHSRGR